MNQDTLVFDVTFHGPFRVTTGNPGDGADRTINRSNPLPGSSLKGTMRSAAEEVIDPDGSLLKEVFGTPAQESPWVWTDCEFRDSHVDVQAQVRIDPDSGTALRDFLFFSEQVQAPGGSFRIVRRGPLSPARLERHRALLVLCARAVKHLGADRRRGQGWVTITATRTLEDAPPNPPLPELLDLVRATVPVGSREDTEAR